MLVPSGYSWEEINDKNTFLKVIKHNQNQTDGTETSGSYFLFFIIQGFHDMTFKTSLVTCHTDWRVLFTTIAAEENLKMSSFMTVFLSVMEIGDAESKNEVEM